MFNLVFQIISWNDFSKNLFKKGKAKVKSIIKFYKMIYQKHLPEGVLLKFNHVCIYNLILENEGKLLSKNVFDLRLVVTTTQIININGVQSWENLYFYSYFSLPAFRWCFYWQFGSQTHGQNSFFSEKRTSDWWSVSCSTAKCIGCFKKVLKQEPICANQCDPNFATLHH